MVLIKQFCIDEFGARKSCLIVTHLIDVGKLDNSKNMCTLGNQSNGGRHKAAYMRHTISIRLSPNVITPPFVNVVDLCRNPNFSMHEQAHSPKFQLQLYMLSQRIALMGMRHSRKHHQIQNYLN